MRRGGGATRRDTSSWPSVGADRRRRRALSGFCALGATGPGGRGPSRPDACACCGGACAGAVCAVPRPRGRPGPGSATGEGGEGTAGGAEGTLATRLRTFFFPRFVACPELFIVLCAPCIASETPGGADLLGEPSASASSTEEPTDTGDADLSSSEPGEPLSPPRELRLRDILLCRCSLRVGGISCGTS